MAKFLVLYGTTEGHTRNIASHISTVLRKKEHTVDLVDSAKYTSVLKKGEYDGVIIGASVHQDKYQIAVEEYVMVNSRILNTMKSAFFSVCLSAAITDKEHYAEARQYISDFLKLTGWKPTIYDSFAGALLYTKYDYFKRLIMKFISMKEGRDSDTSRDYIYTDWDRVTRFANDFEDLVLSDLSKKKEPV
jgi:menaquinone-dependent protoporphyrinogen oxidase